MRGSLHRSASFLPPQVAHCREPHLLQAAQSGAYRYFAAADVVATTDLETACKGVDVAVMVGGFPRKAGMERKDVMSRNVNIYAGQAKALEAHASKDVKVRRTRVELRGRPWGREQAGPSSAAARTAAASAAFA